MRFAVSFAVLILVVACGGVLGQRYRLDGPEGPPRPIQVISARFGGDGKAPSDDVGPLFRAACDGKWRCTVPTPRQLSTKQQAVERAAAYGALYTVDWACGDGTGKHSLRSSAGTRFRLSCLHPEAPDEDGAVPGADSAARPERTIKADGSTWEVQGRFLGVQRAGVADRKILIGDRQTITDQAGSFHLGDVPARYDLSIIDKDGARISLYRGLSRRDPVVAHSGWQNGQGSELRRLAYVSGRVSGPLIPKKDGRLRSTLHFFSALRPHPVYDAGFFGRGYPDEIPNSPISWVGPPTISGRMLVFVTSIEHRDHNDDAFVGLASKRITLEDGDSASEDLTVTPLPMGRIAGTWNPAENPLTRSLAVSYELDDGSGEFWVGSCKLRDSAGRVLSAAKQPVAAPDGERSFDCPLRDVTFLPGRYRVFVMGKDDQILEEDRERLTTCSIHRDDKDALSCIRASKIRREENEQARPLAFTALPNHEISNITRDTVFAWEPQPHAVYAIDLRPNRPFNLVPAISIFTNEASFRWSDLAVHGIGFPTGALYTATVVSIDVSSMDQIASLDWWYGRAAQVGVRETKMSGVRLTDPITPTADPRTPSNVKDLSKRATSLPVCPPGLKGQVLDVGSMGHVVTITGRLVSRVDICLLSDPMSCSHSWFIIDVPGSSLPISLGDGAPGDNSPPIPVMATGLLEDGPRLGRANLCVIGSKP